MISESFRPETIFYFSMLWVLNATCIPITRWLQFSCVESLLCCGGCSVLLSVVYLACVVLLMCDLIWILEKM